MVSVTQVQLSWLCPDSCIVCSTDAIICSNLSTIIGDEASVWFTFSSAVRTEKEMLPDYVQIQFSALLYSCIGYCMVGHQNLIVFISDLSLLRMWS